MWILQNIVFAEYLWTTASGNLPAAVLLRTLEGAFTSWSIELRLKEVETMMLSPKVNDDNNI